MKPTPAFADRLIDATALLMLLGGIVVFALARSALTGIAAETHAMPSGISAVAVTEHLDAQSTMGIRLIGLGLLVGVGAAVRHKLRTR